MEKLEELFFTGNSEVFFQTAVVPFATFYDCRDALPNFWKLPWCPKFLQKVKAKLPCPLKEVSGLWRHVLEKTFSLHVKMCIPDSRSTTARSVCCTALEKTCKLTPSVVVLLHPAAIHLVDIAGRMQEKPFSKRTNSRLGLECTCTYPCSMFDRGKVCLNWRHKRGRRSHHHTTFVSLFFSNI